MPRTKVARKVKYEPVLKLPPLPPDQYDGLRANIAVNGVLVPILVDSNGSKRGIIDGNHRKAIADELGYDCPEIVQAGLEEDEKRVLARALNLARRQLNAEQKRELIADQLRETPDRSSRWIAKMLGVDGKTVASVRAELAATAEFPQFDMTMGQDGKYRPTAKPLKAVARSPVERRARIEATTLIYGDCRHELKKLPSKSVDAVICDPPYPEVRSRGESYPRIAENDWYDLMQDVMTECRRVLKPKGSAVFVLQPNADRMGKMRLWPWRFVLWAGETWNLVEDVYWWNPAAIPCRGARREFGLMRPSIKWCVWLGDPSCYRNQDNVLWTPSDTLTAKRRETRVVSPGGGSRRHSTITAAADERGGTTPFNLLPISAGCRTGGAEDHPAATPYDVAAWWSRYILPPDGVLLDPFCGSGTMLQAGLDHGASRVIGIEKEKKYLAIAKRRIAVG